MRTTKNQPGHSKTAGGTKTAETPLIAEIRKLGVDPLFLSEIIETIAWEHMDYLREQPRRMKSEIALDIKTISVAYTVYNAIQEQLNGMSHG